MFYFSDNYKYWNHSVILDVLIVQTAILIFLQAIDRIIMSASLAHIRRSLRIFIPYYNNNSLDTTKAKTKLLAFSRNTGSCHILENQWCRHGTLKYTQVFF